MELRDWGLDCEEWVEEGNLPGHSVPGHKRCLPRVKLLLQVLAGAEGGPSGESCWTGYRATRLTECGHFPATCRV